MLVETATGTLKSVTRLTNSRNGNPRYILHTTNGDFTTKIDSMCAFNVQSFIGKRVTLTLTRQAGSRESSEKLCQGA